MSYKSQHTVILGDGLAGLFAALKLSEAGFSVTVIHAPAGQGEASPLAQGVICSKGLTVAESELFAAKLRGQEALFSWLKRLPEVARIEGIIEPYGDEQECERILKRVYRKAHFNEAGTQIAAVARDDTSIFDPEKVAGTLVYPGDYWFDVEDFLAKLRSLLLEKGVRFVADEVVRFATHANGWRVIAVSNEYFCEELVLATGFKTDEMLVQSGFSPLGLIACHGVILRGISANVLPSCAFVRGTKSVVCHKYRVQIGGTSAKDWFAGDLAKHAAELRADLLPLLERRIFSETKWTELHGVRVRAKDRMPVVGPWKSLAEDKSLYVLTGLYKNGLQLAEACAEHLAQAMMGRESPVQTRLFDSRRLGQKAK